MFKPQSFNVEEMVQEPDGIGGFDARWEIYATYQGYLDLSNGTDLNNVQNAIVEQSTHVLIIPGMVEKKPKEKMRVVDQYGRYYSINYVDDPLGQGHHLEIALTFGGTIDE